MTTPDRPIDYTARGPRYVLAEGCDTTHHQHISNALNADPLRTPELTYRIVTIPDAPIGLDDTPVTDAPTDTSTCHCWANHPNLAGRCEAASHPGLAIDQQPVCHGCWAATHTPGSHSRGRSLTIPWNETRGWEFLGYTTEDDLDAAMRPQEDQ